MVEDGVGVEVAGLARVRTSCGAFPLASREARLVLVEFKPVSARLYVPSALI